MSARAWLALAPAALAPLWAACNGVGFHEDSKVDFDRYPSATVAPFTATSAYADAEPVPEESRGRFVDELERIGGFESVRAAAGSADLVIRVDVSHIAVRHTGNESCCSVAGFLVTSLFDAECQNAHVAIEVELDMEATDASGAVVYSLRGADGSSGDYECASDGDLQEAYVEALDDALEEVAVFFLAGFDI